MEGLLPAYRKGAHEEAHRCRAPAVERSCQCGWTVFQENSKGDTFMMDRTTIQRSGQTVKVWTMVSFTKPQALAGGYGRSIKIQDEYNCATREKRALHMVNYGLPIVGVSTR